MKETNYLVALNQLNYLLRLKNLSQSYLNRNAGEIANKAKTIFEDPYIPKAIERLAERAKGEGGANAAESIGKYINMHIPHTLKLEAELTAREVPFTKEGDWIIIHPPGSEKVDLEEIIRGGKHSFQ